MTLCRSGLSPIAALRGRRPAAAGCLLAGLLAGLWGCNSLALRSQSPEDAAAEVESSVRLVGDLAKPYGASFIKVESVALATRLAGTGENPAPSPQRAALLREMQTLGVPKPSQVLASPDTALILVHGFIPPGADKGDQIDLEVQVPARSETSSLRGGWLMESRLREMAVLGNQIHDGYQWAVGTGPILVEPGTKAGQNRGALQRGRVLGGGTVTKSRSLGLVLSSDEKSVRRSAQIGAALNKRFHTFAHGTQTGVATPKTDEFVELLLHPRYKDNISRYLRVVRSVPLGETPSEQTQRLKLLRSQLLDPLTAATAALRLEAIGKPAIDTLLAGLESADPEVRFYAAEALAYLDERRACEPLAEAARNEPAFRAYALAALSAMDDPLAADQLRGLLDATSAETRYGAFCSLWAMNAQDPLVRGENLGGQFSYHVLPSAGPPMVHVARTRRAEVVLFGADQRLATPLALEAGKSILVTAGETETVVVSRFSPDQPDQKRQVSNKLDEVLRAVVDLGGTYPDVVEMLEQARSSRALRSRFEVDALPLGGRDYARGETSESVSATEPPPSRFEVANPLPELFAPHKGR